jgi:hypothetical protein
MKPQPNWMSSLCETVLVKKLCQLFILILPMNITVRYNFSCHSLNQAYYFLKNVPKKNQVSSKIFGFEIFYSGTKPHDSCLFLNIYSNSDQQNDRVGLFVCKSLP